MRRPVSARADRVAPDRPAPAATEQADRCLTRARSARWLVIALGCGVFFAGFDQTFVVTILPDMLRDLGIPLGQLGRASWIVNGYLIGYAVALPLMGRIADAFGRTRIYTAAIGVYILGSVGSAVAPNLEALTVARLVQALGGGAVVPISMAIVADVIAPAWRPVGIGVIAALDDASSLLGPLYASALVDPLGWRGLFWLNIPLQLPFLLAVLLLARDLPRGGRPSVDITGGLLLAGGLTVLAVALTDTSYGRRAPALTAALLFGALLLGGAFVARQARLATPLIRLGLFRARASAAAIGLYFVDGAATITALVTVPLMTNALWNGSPLDGGLNLMKMMVWMPVGSIAGGLLTRWAGYRFAAIASFSLVGVAYAWMWRWPAEPGTLALWGALCLLGFGIGLNDAPVIGSLLTVARAADRATATALTQTSQTIGMIVGMALLASQGLGRFDRRAADLFSRRGLDASAAEYGAIVRETFDEVFVVAAIVCLLAAFASLLLARGRAAEVRWTSVVIDDAGRSENRPAVRHIQ